MIVYDGSPKRTWINVNKPLTWSQRWRALFGRPFTMYGWIHRTELKPHFTRWTIDP